MTSLASLLEQSQRLDQSHHLSPLSSSQLPSLALDLSTIESQSRRIASRSKPHPSHSDSTYLLSRAGLNPSQLTQNINQLNPTSTFEPLLPLSETDLEGFVKHSHEQVIISAIEEGRRSTQNQFYRKLQDGARRNWEKQKEGLWEELGRHGTLNGDKALGNEKKNTSTSSNGPSTSASSSQGNLSQSGSLQMHSKMMRYDLVISRLNKFRLESYSFAIISSLLEASISPSSSTTSANDQVTETWRLLASLVGEKDVLNGEFQRKALGEREFRNAYLSEGSGSGSGEGQESKELRRMLTRGGKEYLEGQFMQYVEKTLASKLSSANLGGIPSIQNKIRAFLEVKYKKSTNSTSSKDNTPEWSNSSLEIANNTPIWARIYYLLRSGHAQESLSFAIENQPELNKLEKSFVAYYKSWIDSSSDPVSRRLPKLLRDRFLSEYNQRLRYTSPSSDPYKFALYKLLGRVELSKRNVPGVTQTTEDWVWFQLSLLREDEEEGGGHERYGLRELGKVLRRFGESHFSPGGKRPLLYFQVLVLSGQFELAVAFLYEQPQYQVDAVHFAIALTYYGLLRATPSTSTSSAQNSLLSNPESDTPSIAFSRLLHRYTRSFVHSDPLEALQYLYLICLNSDLSQGQGKKEVEVAHEYVRELVMDTRQYSALLGDVRNDGTKIAGQIEKDSKLLQLPDSQTYLLSIVQTAAHRANSEQRFSEAILLYNLAEEYDSVIQVLNTELSNSLSSPSSSINSKTGHSLDGNAYFAQGSQTMGGMTKGNQEVAEVAKSILEHYERSSGMIGKVKRKNRETCLVLMRLKEGIKFYEQSQYEQALQTIESTSLIPLSSDLVTIIRASEELKNLPDSILRNLDIILLTTMTTLYKLHQQLKESPHGADQSRQEKMLELRSKGRSLIMFAGMLRYRLTSETYSQLTRLDVFLH